MWVQIQSSEPQSCEVYSHGFESSHRNHNLVRSTRAGSNPVIGTTNHKPTANSAVHPSEVGKRVLRSNSDGTSTKAVYTLIAANLKWNVSSNLKIRPYFSSFI